MINQTPLVSITLIKLKGTFLLVFLMKQTKLDKLMLIKLLIHTYNGTLHVMRITHSLNAISYYTKSHNFIIQ